VAFTPSPAYARLPPRAPTPDDPRFLDLLVPDAAQADLLLAGIPYDGAVIGRKGAKGGPDAIREAFRYLGAWNPAGGMDGQSLKGLRIHDLGDAAVVPGDTLATHAVVRTQLAEALRSRQAMVALGGDNSLSFPTFQALHDTYGGKWCVVVVDAHYDLRPYEGQPTSGTPYRRILEEIPERPVRGPDLVELGIRAWANAPGLAAYAKEAGVRVVPAERLRSSDFTGVVGDVLPRRGTVDHIFLSVDIDALDQSIAPGCSAPGPGGLSFREAEAIVRMAGSDPRTRGMDLVEVAPNLDPTGNTPRVAAQLVATFAAAVHARKRA